MVVAPSSSICRWAARLMPSPMANSQTTPATPMKIPSTVSIDRSGCSSRLLRLSSQVRIELDADPEHPLEGKVKEIAKAPYPVRWHGAPIEYGAVVTIIDPPSTLRPNNRAKVKITFESRDDVLQVPLAAVIEHEDRHYCLVREDDTWRQQVIKIGSNNNAQVIVMEGLEEGEQVSLTPFRFIERTDLPDKETDSDVPGEKPGKLTQAAP